jgi:hypothetical protein
VPTTVTPTPTSPPPGIVCDARLIIKKFHDLNANRTRDDDEPYLSGWIFRITVDGQVIDVVTNETGTAELGGLKGGQTVTIEERLDLLRNENWISTTGNPIQTTLDCGDNLRIFGNVRGKPPKTGRAEVGTSDTNDIATSKLQGETSCVTLP